MSFMFCKRSLNNLFGNGDVEHCVHPILIELMLFSIRTSDHDFSIICGWRSDSDQEKAYKEGKSQLRGGTGKHNLLPSKAIDIAPYPVDFDDISKYLTLGDHIKKCAEYLNIPIIWGGDWKMRDYGHFELPDNINIALEMAIKLKNL